MEVVIKRDYDLMSKAAAQLVVDVLNTKPNAVLGMATGSTPLGLYQELVRVYKQGQLDRLKLGRILTAECQDLLHQLFGTCASGQDTLQVTPRDTIMRDIIAG